MNREIETSDNLTDPLEALRTILPAGAFSQEELEEMLPLCQIARVEAESVLITEGEPSDARVYFILSGSVSVHIQGKFILKLKNRGDTVGEMGLISAAPRSATVKTDEPCVFLIVHAPLEGLEKQDSDYKFRYFMSRIFNSILTEKLRRTSDRARLYEDMALRSRTVEAQQISLEEEIATYLHQISLYSHLVDSAKDSILITDTEGRILIANPALKQTFGIDTDQVIGVEFSALLQVPQAGAVEWEHISQRASQKGWHGEVLLQHPTKEATPADCSISAVHDADGEAMAYSVILRDISERKALEEETRRQRQELERAYQKLRELDRAKSKFLSLVSHELRTPIASIMAYSEVLNTEGMADPEDQTKFIDVIHQEAEKLTEMVNKVLAMSKMESGQMLFNFAENQLEELVRMQVAMWRPRAESKHLVMTYEAEPELRPTVYDEDNIREAVEQLIDNAIKYTESGTIKVRVSQDDSETWIRIEDSGRGIEGQDLGQLLENFGRGDQTATGHGLGLGLPLCYLIVKAHSGELHLEPNQQKGTTASIVLPLRPPPEAMAS